MLTLYLHDERDSTLGTRLYLGTLEIREILDFLARRPIPGSFDFNVVDREAQLGAS